MDPAAMAAAIAAAYAVKDGLVAGVTETAKQAVGDAYKGLKAILRERYTSVDIDVVEAGPQVPARQAVLAGELDHAGAGADVELTDAVQVLLTAITQHTPAAAQVVGVQLRRLEAGRVEVRGIRAAGASGVVAEDVTVSGELSVTDVEVVSELPDPH
ncbi:hypothetical protein [Rhodococcoides fascians]|uniref:hypothetical protein n=1 Tax=Rhodococcoides fascians TaxID=1828 RepID=UPI00068D01B9|nr:hypothetical protein [Rhodococcus fascians]